MTPAGHWQDVRLLEFDIAGSPSHRRHSHFHAALCTFYREPLKEHTGRCTDDSAADSGSGLTHRPGDVLNVMPRNSEAAAREFCRALGRLRRGRSGIVPPQYRLYVKSL